MVVKQVIGGIFEDVGEAVAKPVRDEVGRAIEIGVKSVVQGPPALDPKKQAEEEQKRQKKIADWRWVIQKQKELSEAQRKVREEAKQKQLQEAQATQQEKQDKELKEVFKEKDDTALRQAQRKTEIKGGVGG